MTVKLSIPASLLIGGSVGRQTIGSLGSSEDSTTGSLKKPTFSERHPKAVRSVTVIGYLFCVSLAAILLSSYYVVLWKPKLMAPEDPKNTTTLPLCHQYMSTEAGSSEQVQNVRRPRYHPYSSKRTHSRFILNAPVIPKLEGPVVHKPSKRISPPERVESFQHVDSNNNNNSLQRNNSTPSGFAPAHNNNSSNVTSYSTRTTPNDTSAERHDEPAKSEYEDGFAESTFVPNPSSSPNSIIITKLLHDKKVGSNNSNRYTGRIVTDSLLVDA